MSVIDWDDAYDNLGHVPNGLSYPPLWTERASAYRLTARAVLDLSYGKNDREVFDLFLPEGASKGLAVFVHGGFWVKFDKSVFSHVAAGAVARGWTVAVPSYPLAPNVRISEITQAVAQAEDGRAHV